MLGIPATRAAVAAAISAAISGNALMRSKSLDRSGALAGFLVMALHFAAGYRFGAVLLAFFLSSSKLTKVGRERKRGADEHFKEGGQRNWLQVLANSGVATILVLVHSYVAEGEDRCLSTKESVLVTGLIGGVIGHYACCNGDTWSSEIGILSTSQPRLITTFKTVRRGTNGGVSKEGLLASVAAGFVIGITYVFLGLFTVRCDDAAVAWRQLLVVPVASAAGFCGSLIDSLLGATLQFSGFCNVRKMVVSKPAPSVTRISGVNVLDNNGVNAVSVLLTTLLTSVVCLFIF